MKRNDKDVEESSRRITRRALVLGGLQVSVLALLAGRMRYLQIDQADQYRMLAEENRVSIRLIPPTRGLIADRTGTIIAGNEQNYRVVIVREDAGDVGEVLNRLSRVIPMSEDERERTLREIRRRSAFVPITVADRLSWKEFSEVAVNGPALPGVTPEVGLSRFYPLRGDFAHVAGYVGPVSENDLANLESHDPVLQIPKFQIGKNGVEQRMEDVLRGTAGSKRIEVNAVGRVMRELSRQEGDAGGNVQLTVDHRLQRYTLDRLGEDSAAAVVMDVHNGDLLALVSAPSFDPNLFVRGISVADYRALMSNDHRPLANKTVQGTYPPGSTFKMVTALAAMKAGMLDPSDSVYCPGYLAYGGRRFHCWRHGGHGRLSLVEALAQSCDVFFYEIAQRVGIDKISEMSRLLGLGVRHDLPLSAVAEGLAPTQAWKRQARGESWLVGDTINASIGQGFNLSSPLQLCVMTARIATGRNVLPRLIKSIDGIEQPLQGGEELGLSAAHLAQVRRGMDQVMNGRTGTARGSRIADEAMLMAGKTGTAQVRNISAAERASGVLGNHQLPWNRRDHALFVAYAPVHAPRIAVSVVVEHGGGGSAVAAPIARDMIKFALGGGLGPTAVAPPAEGADPAPTPVAPPSRTTRA
ncbi:penicillin-binding protein [Haematobacter missouriensis]|uniref:Penicillin-binding protein 2 n=1 Tax=Haematobacter missouriensis TaxID=366616 RepID=A0A212AJF2_9RHOB|nr:penicillin-binding protein 2 [Haematobacter missouriensis]KFI32792.1 penicillin-binding protein [Haematobacter missouriensis]OWJ77449.1 penicillin-binding protein 2 [Haematobacter missouriensis]OWJ81624.1 penicillin-binding protein 2 [Haematobacter missouriensis]